MLYYRDSSAWNIPSADMRRTEMFLNKVTETNVNQCKKDIILVLVVLFGLLICLFHLFSNLYVSLLAKA